MTEQPDALRLAGWLEHIYVHYDGEGMTELQPAAAELRRLHARDKEWESVTGFMQTTTDRMESELRRLHSVNAQLLEALEDMVRMMDSGEEHGAGSPWHTEATAAIAAAKEMK